MTALRYISRTFRVVRIQKKPLMRTNCEACQRAFVELANMIDRHVRLLGQGVDGSLVPGALVGRCRRAKPVYMSLS
jgi:hypothetical protein